MGRDWRAYRSQWRGPVRRRALYWAARVVAVVLVGPLMLLAAAVDQLEAWTLARLHQLEAWAWPGLYLSERQEDQLMGALKRHLE